MPVFKVVFLLRWPAAVCIGPRTGWTQNVLILAFYQESRIPSVEFLDSNFINSRALLNLGQQCISRERNSANQKKRTHHLKIPVPVTVDRELFSEPFLLCADLSPGADHRLGIWLCKCTGEVWHGIHVVTQSKETPWDKTAAKDCHVTSPGKWR